MSQKVFYLSKMQNYRGTQGDSEQDRFLRYKKIVVISGKK